MPDLTEQLKNNNALKSVDIRILGLPPQMFAFAALFAGFGFLLSISQMGLLLGGLIGGVFSVVVFTPLGWIHKDDAHAWRLWIEAIHTPFLHATPTKKRSVYVLKRGQVIQFKQWKPFR